MTLPPPLGDLFGSLTSYSSKNMPQLGLHRRTDGSRNWRRHCILVVGTVSSVSALSGRIGPFDLPPAMPALDTLPFRIVIGYKAAAQDDAALFQVSLEFGSELRLAVLD